MAHRYKWGLDGLWQSLLAHLDNVPRSVHTHYNLSCPIDDSLHDTLISACLLPDTGARNIDSLYSKYCRSRASNCLSAGAGSALDFPGPKHWMGSRTTLFKHLIVSGIGRCNDITSTRRVLTMQNRTAVGWGRYDALLGKISDKSNANIAGVTRCTVLKRRTKLKIPAYSPTSVITDFDHLPGTVPDQLVAGLAGVTKNAITSHRAKLGIASWKSKKAPPLEPFVRFLGKLSDAEIANRAGVTPAAVLKQRRQGGIPAYKRKVKNVTVSD